MPGSRCRDAATIERCAGPLVLAASCDEGTVCGPDPGTGLGATCVARGQTCGNVTSAGVCVGAEILGWCLRDQLEVVDCSVLHARCIYDEAISLASCATDCSLSNVTAEGRCTDTGFERCLFVDGGYRVDRVDCPFDTHCGTHPDTGSPTCLPTQSCADLGPLGRCVDDSLLRCIDGTVVEMVCLAGARCAYGGPDGYGCVDAGTVGALFVAGRVRFEDRPPLTSGIDGLEPVPARGIGVAIVDDATGTALAVAGTDGEGRFRLAYDASVGQAVHLLALSASAIGARPVQVLRPDGTLHGFASPSFAAGANETVELLVTERSGVAEALNILDFAGAALAAIRLQVDVPVLQPLVLVWAKGATEGTYTDDNNIYLIGALDDDDGYDDAVIGHELGHYFEQNYGRTSNPGLPHLLYAAVSPPLAWSEGWATYFGGQLRGTSIYFDDNALGGLRFDIDRDVTLMSGTSLAQPISENTVAEILWDLGDTGIDDDDPVAGLHERVVAVEPEQLAHGGDRGGAGVDLVDFLDGWLVLIGSDGCAGLRAILNLRTVPYDGKGAVTCP